MTLLDDMVRTGLPKNWCVRRTLPEEEAVPVAGASLPAAGSLEVPSGRVLIVANDAQRATPTPWLISRLDIDWRRRDIEFAVASGSHRPPDEQDLSAIFGPYLDRVRSRLRLHDSGRAGLLLGTTSRGTPVEVNPCLEGRAAVICLGSVEPHYFAGWTGGRKSIVPGLCSLETMRCNHRLAMEGGLPGFPEACPVSLDLDEALALCTSRLGSEHGTRFIALNVVARDDDVYGLHWGPAEDTLAALGPGAKRLFGRRSGGPADMVIAAVSAPLDRDLYQALKAFEHWKRVVAPGGMLALAAPCPDGIGPPTFVQFLQSPPGLHTLRSRTGETYRLGDHKLANYLAYRESGRHLTLISQGPLEAVRADIPVDSDHHFFLKRAHEAFGSQPASLLFVEDGAHTYPVDLPTGRKYN